MVKDTQVVEILGKNYLINQLLRAGVEVAVPVRDTGIDLIVYLNKEKFLNGYSARPIQIKAASSQSFSIDKKYEKYPHLILTFIWHLDDPKKIVVYGLDYQDAISVAASMGYTKTDSWRKGKYTTTKPSEKLIKLLQPYKMTAKTWKKTLVQF